MLLPKRTIPLPEHVHGHAQRTNDHLDAAEDGEHARDARAEDPGVGKVGQDKTEDVLEDDQRREDLDVEVAVGVEQVLGGADGGHDHGRDDEGDEDVGHEPAVAERVCGGDAEAVEARGGEGQRGRREQHAVLGLVLARVEAGQGARGEFGEERAEHEAEHGADEGRRVHLAGLFFGEEERGREEDQAQDHADHDRPADDDALHQAAPEHGWLQVEWEGPEEQLEVAVVGLAAVEEVESFDVGVSCWWDSRHGCGC